MEKGEEDCKNRGGRGQPTGRTAERNEKPQKEREKGEKTMLTEAQ